MTAWTGFSPIGRPFNGPTDCLRPSTCGKVSAQVDGVVFETFCVNCNEDDVVSNQEMSDCASWYADQAQRLSKHELKRRIKTALNSCPSACLDNEEEVEKVMYAVFYSLTQEPCKGKCGYKISAPDDDGNEWRLFWDESEFMATLFKNGKMIATPEVDTDKNMEFTIPSAARTLVSKDVLDELQSLLITDMREHPLCKSARSLKRR